MECAFCLKEGEAKGDEKGMGCHVFWFEAGIGAVVYRVGIRIKTKTSCSSNSYYLK